MDTITRYTKGMNGKIKYFPDDPQDKFRKALQAIILIACAAMLIFITLGCLKFAFASEIVDVNKLATAIYYAENSKSHPYGILAHYKHTTPRNACLNTIKSAMRRYAKTNQRMDFVKFLSLTYCPIGALNDPRGLNKNWVKNVKHFLQKGRE